MRDRVLIFTKIKGVLSNNDKHTMQVCMKELIKICISLKAEIVLIDVPDYHQDRSKCTPGTRALLDEFNSVNLSIAGEVNSETIKDWLVYNNHGEFICLINDNDVENFSNYRKFIIDESRLLSAFYTDDILSIMRKAIYK